MKKATAASLITSRATVKTIIAVYLAQAVIGIGIGIYVGYTHGERPLTIFMECISAAYQAT